MKKIINLFSIIFCLLIMNKSHSQNEASKHTIEIGVNVIKQNTYYHFDMGFRDVALNSSNYAYRLSISTQVKKFISFQTGLQLSNQGQRFLLELSNNARA